MHALFIGICIVILVYSEVNGKGVSSLKLFYVNFLGSLIDRINSEQKELSSSNNELFDPDKPLVILFSKNNAGSHRIKSADKGIVQIVENI